VRGTKKSNIIWKRTGVGRETPTIIDFAKRRGIKTVFLFVRRGGKGSHRKVCQVKNPILWEGGETHM